jgi:hypothetical protein
VSLDGLCLYGGEVTTDDVPGNNRQRAFFVGGTFGFALSRELQVKLSYGESASTNPSGPDGRMYRSILSYVF